MNSNFTLGTNMMIIVRMTPARMILDWKAYVMLGPASKMKPMAVPSTLRINAL